MADFQWPIDTVAETVKSLKRELRIVDERIADLEARLEQDELLRNGLAAELKRLQGEADD